MEAGSSSNSSGTSRTCPFLRRQSTKRSYSDMNTASRHASASHGPRDTSPLFVQDDHYDNEHAIRRRRLDLPNPQPMPGHFPGDGLDYRQPILSLPQQSQVIDLTAESPEARRSAAEAYVPHHSLALPSIRAQRLPRYDRNIISISDEDEEIDPEAGTAAVETHGMAHDRQEWQERSEHPRYSVLRRPHRGVNPGGHTQAAGGNSAANLTSRGTRDNLFARVLPPPISRSITPHPSNMHEPIDLTADLDDEEDEQEDDDDDVVHLDTRPRPGANSHRPDVGVRDPRANPDQDTQPFQPRNLPSRLYERMLNYTGRDLFARDQVPPPHHELHQHFHHMVHEARVHLDRERHRVRPARRNQNNGRPAATSGMNAFHMPHLMEYELPAFEMGLAGGNRPPSPQYVPPSDVAHGFTRSPGEDEVVVCPNCGDELAIGAEPQKREVWVVKACGHAYCGDCASSVSRKGKSASHRPPGKGKGRARDESDDIPPLRQCVVYDCCEKITKSAIIRIYSS